MTVEVPDAVRSAHEGWSFALAWSYVDASSVWRLQSPAGESRFLKLLTLRRYPSLAEEADRMRWALARLPVPAVLGRGIEGDVEWLLMSALPGVAAHELKAEREPRELVPILAHGLREFHSVAWSDCPFDFTLDAAVAHVRRRVEDGLIVNDYDFHSEHAAFTPETALAWLEEHRPPTEDLVLCHGDYCLPNVLIEGDRVTGFVDLGELGAADRWWDLSIAAWSVTWNLGPGWEDLFYESYGIEPDEHRIAYYRLLYDLVS